MGRLSGDEGPGNSDERKQVGEEMRQRIRDYATNETGLQPGPVVMSWHASKSAMENDLVEEAGNFATMVNGKTPREGQRIVYVDGGYDLFSSGHIEFLRQVTKAEAAIAQNSGWFQESATTLRIDQAGEDYGPAYIVAGIHDDEVINRWKGVNYPIMNIFERGLCVLQCRVRNYLFYAQCLSSFSTR